jgi:hypothetical protein
MLATLCCVTPQSLGCPMKVKDSSVQCNFAPFLTRLLVEVVDQYYRSYDDELVITSGGEWSARHRRGSFHYQDPALAADIRTWDQDMGRGSVPPARTQYYELTALIASFCTQNGLPQDCVDVVLERTHIHVELHFKGDKA